MKKFLFLNLFIFTLGLFLVSCEKSATLVNQSDNDETAVTRKYPCESKAILGTHYTVTPLPPAPPYNSCCMKIKLIPATAGIPVFITAGGSTTSLVTNASGEVTYCGPFVATYDIQIKRPGNISCGSFASPCE